MQSLCTLRDHCRQGPRNTRYQADATPYLGRTSTGWIAPALPGALIRSPRRRGRVATAGCEAEPLRGLQVYQQVESGLLVDRNFARACPSENPINVGGNPALETREVRPIDH